MSRVHVPSGELSWEEKLDIRKEALRAAVEVYRGKGDYITNEWGIVNLATRFESYLKGNANG